MLWFLQESCDDGNEAVKNKNDENYPQTTICLVESCTNVEVEGANMCAGW